MIWPPRRLAVVLVTGLALVASSCSTPARRRSNTVQAGTFDLVLEREGTVCRGVMVLSDTFISPSELPRYRGLRVLSTKPSGTFNACLVITEPAGKRCALSDAEESIVRLFEWGVREGEAYASMSTGAAWMTTAA